MAAIHPSRLGLVPSSSSNPTQSDRRDRRPSPSYQPRDRDFREADYIPLGGAPPPPPAGGRAGERDGRDARDPGRDTANYGYGDERARQLGYDERRGGDNRDPRDARDGRYFDRERGPGGPPPWRGDQGPPQGQGYGGGGGGDYGGGGRGGGGGFRGAMSAQEMTARRIQREQSTIIVWPPSPKRAIESDDDDNKKSKRSKKKSKSSRHRSSSKHKSSRRRRDDTETEDTESEDSEEEERRRRKRKEKERERTTREKDSQDRGGKSIDRVEEEDDWVVADPTTIGKDIVPASAVQDMVPGQILMDDEEVGPQVPIAAIGKDGKVDMKAYAHMRPGEGAAMAAFAASGERIPRRGEIGLSSAEIDTYEQVGYVMSGSRHRRMNAVRMRKENQVISAEEKRGILKLQKEEKDKREGLIVNQFKEMIEDKLSKVRQ